MIRFVNLFVAYFGFTFAEESLLVLVMEDINTCLLLVKLVGVESKYMLENNGRVLLID